MKTQALNFTSDETVANQVENELREAIVRLEILPGERLSEQEIGNRFGISRQPVREALISLARSKLVEIRPNRGTFVVRISIEQMLEARFVREAVESAVVRRACETFDPWVMQRLKSNLRQQEAVVADGDYNAFRELDSEFHVLIARGAGCMLAWEAIADMKSLMDRTCNLSLAKAETRLPLLVQHKALVAAIDAKDADLAEKIMREHLSAILQDLPEISREHAGLFE